MDFKDQLIKDILNELAVIKDAIQNKNLDQATRDKLFEKREILQSKVNELLKRKGILTDTEADNIYKETQINKKRNLEISSKRGLTSLYIAGAILIIGIYFALKKKK